MSARRPRGADASRPGFESAVEQELQSRATHGGKDVRLESTRNQREKAVVKYLNPRASTAIEIETYDLAHDIRENDGSGVTVGLLANGFPDSELFLTKVASVLESRLPNLETRLWNKGNAGVPASREMLEEVTSSCHVAIAAYGH